MKKYKVGYTTGVYDLFHIGHVRLLKGAKERCDKLIVGVTIDGLVSYKFKKAIISFEERMEIVASVSYVDCVVPQISMDKYSAWEKLKFDVIFVGDDWKGTEKWNNYEKIFNNVGVRIIYLPYTKGVSSTFINELLDQLRSDN